MTTVSLIIPCYNDGAYLEEALNSVFSQSRTPDEIIVVDDGSTDDSAEVVMRHQARVRLIRQENRGICGARNAGLAAAQGSLIAFLDADDLWPRHSLQVRLERMQAAPAVECVFGLSEQFFSPELDEETRSRLYCPPGAAAARFAGAMLARRAVFDRVGPFDPTIKLGEMIDWIARLTQDGASVDIVEAVVMRRRIHGGNTVIRERGFHGDYLKALKAALDRKNAVAAAAAD